MRKKIIGLVIIFCLIFSLSACNTDNADAEINDLKTRIEDLETKEAKINGRIDELEEENKRLSGIIDELEEENKRLSDKVEVLENSAIITWTNDNAIYVSIRHEYCDEIYQNIDGAFPLLNLKKTLIFEKHYVYYNYLTLLLILEDEGKENQAAALEVLYADNRVSYAHHCYDAPFEGENTLKLTSSDYILYVGETLTVQWEGGIIKYYGPDFSLDKIIIGMDTSDPDRDFTPADFPNIKLSSVKKWEHGFYADVMLTLTLAEPGYFEVINAANTLALTPDIKYVEMLRYPVSDVAKEPAPYIPNCWSISDVSVVDFVTDNAFYVPENHRAVPDYIVETEPGEVQIKGLKPGYVDIMFEVPWANGKYKIRIGIEVFDILD